MGSFHKHTRSERGFLRALENILGCSGLFRCSMMPIGGDLSPSELPGMLGSKP